MAAPATCIATASTATRRPSVAMSLATTAGKRVLGAASVSLAQSSSFSAAAGAAAPGCQTPSNVAIPVAKSQSPILPFVRLQQRWNHSSVALGRHQSLSLRSARSTNKSIGSRNKDRPASARTFSSSSKRDFYEVLSVGKGADKAEIKKAYFKLAKKYHPDTNKVRCQQCNGDPPTPTVQ